MRIRYRKELFLWAAISLLECFSLFGQSVRTPSVAENQIGILLMAHGGNKEWNAKVENVAAEVDKQIPTEVAFGMADRATLQAAIDKLAARGAKRIVAVPLFISSHSGVIEATKYLLGQRSDAPKDITDFAMSPEMHGKHEAEPSVKPLEPSRPTPQPVKSPVPVKMTAALDGDPLVAAILADHAAAIAKNPRTDAIVLVAHGPTDDASNARWLADMETLAQQIAAHSTYARIDCVTLRDDADPPVRDVATAEFRKVVRTDEEAGYRVLIVPLLLSYGGIENGVRQRLDGIDHTFSAQALLPDPRIAQWVLQQARTPERSGEKGF